MYENSLAKFQDLLRTLFQFDCADLDFGIYRILNYKRGQVEAFLTKRLPQIVDQAFAQYAAADKAEVEQELEQTRQEIVKNLGEQAIDESGQLRNYHKTKLGKQYLLLLEKREKYQVAEELKTRVYNDLYTFFSRYYEDGDFISKRRYGRRETYAIPYHGEEVLLYWANRDQYYIKTGERFKAYRFKAGDYTIVFELRNATPEQNGNGGKKRYFVLPPEAPISWNEQQKMLSIAFEYRPLTESEEKQHGKTEQQKPQDSLSESAERAVLAWVTEPALKTTLARMEKRNDKEKSVLRWRLDHFTRKNASDFFIHKDLLGFLRRELDFFIKNEVLLLDELIGGGEEDLREHVQRGRVVRQVAEAIIEFLAQVEDFQKRLWEKKKFVVRTEYCLTIDRLPEELWGEVLANKAQIAEWRQLYSIEGRVNKSFLKAHRTLVVDTRHFSEDFKWRLLASFDDLDGTLDGLLIKSENWQTLNLLLEKYREKVKCIYIDPPYNTFATKILYKNEYEHSSWLSLLENRLTLSKQLLSNTAITCTTIDDYEIHRLLFLLDRVYGMDNYLATVAIRNNPSGRSTVKGFSVNHEYGLFFCRSAGSAQVGYMPHTHAQRERYNETDAAGRRFEWENFRKSSAGSFRSDRPKQYFPLYYDSKAKRLRVPILAWQEAIRSYQIMEEPRDCDLVIWPKDSAGRERVWRYGVERTRESLVGATVREVDSRFEVYTPKYLQVQGILARTWWDKPDYSARDNGTRALNELFGSEVGKLFDFPKAPKAVEDAVRVCNPGQDGVVLDYFAGSGTTAHAAINLNRQDGGKRKYILVEIGDWFETVMLPRIKKVVFCEKWRDGKPQGGPGVSHLLKYQYLEQYDDVLSNLELPRAAEGQKMLELFGDEYLLKYMLDFETQGSASLLNLSMFKEPFAYKLKVQEGDEIVERPVDVVETFNYLLGIQVKKVRAFHDNGRLYRAVLGEKNGKRTAIVWRSIVGLEDNEKALMKDKAFIKKSVLPALLGEAKPDRLLVNGACFVKDAEAIEPEFKRLMFAPVGV